MDFPGCTDQLLVANYQATDLPDNVMFGFDVEDDNDREYLAEVAMRRIGHADDIKRFVRLSLLRGMEEWEQALCCASAIKGQRSFHDPLDGQDLLTFLSRIYGVDKPCHATDAPALPHKPRHPRSKLKSRKASVSLEAEIPLKIPAKKRKRVKNGRDSPYWKETPVLVREEGQSRNPPRTKIKIKSTPMLHGKCLEEELASQSPIPTDEAEAYTVLQARERSELKSLSLDPPYESLHNPSSGNAQGPTSQFRDHDPGGILSNKSSGILKSISKPELDTPVIRSSDALQLDIDTERTGLESTGRAIQATDNGTVQPSAQEQTPKRKAKSPYFEIAKAAPNPPKSSKSPNKRPPRGTVSSLPFPPLDSPCFGLIQEELADNPFRLLIAVTFLIRTSGKAAIPVFRALMEEYPTPDDLAEADTADIIAMIKHLGLGAVRAAKMQRYARTWVKDPPRNGVRHAVKNYCRATTGENDFAERQTGAEGETASSSAWEIGHLTQGPYALDSWRIFCRDVLRGAAADWRGGGREGEFQPEWMRVRPRDKELRAFLRWMWMREGWQWDPVTGEKAVLPDGLRRAVQEGRVGYDDAGNLRILDDQTAACGSSGTALHK